MIHSMRDYTLRFYPEGHCTTRMTIGFRTTRVESDCGMKGYHALEDGQWRCCQHYAACEGGCWMRGILADGPGAAQPREDRS
jgi:hypothetical protein